MIVPVLVLLAQASASLGVGATVVRSVPPPAIAVERGAAIVRNAGAVVVTAEGASVRRGDDGAIQVTPRGPGAVTITLTY